MIERPPGPQQPDDPGCGDYIYEDPPRGPHGFREHALWWLSQPKPLFIVAGIIVLGVLFWIIIGGNKPNPCEDPIHYHLDESGTKCTAF